MWPCVLPATTMSASIASSFPPPIASPFTATMVQEPVRLLRGQGGARGPHHGTPEDIAEAAVYFGLPGNRYATGAILSVDGGSLAR